LHRSLSEHLGAVQILLRDASSLGYRKKIGGFITGAPVSETVSISPDVLPVLILGRISSAKIAIST
jgi:hypothetical protein